MADYYPLLSRAVEGLSDKSPEMRRAVYDRARAALIEQLRSLDPPLSEGDITRERLALDEAIDRVEADYGAPVAAPLPELEPVPEWPEPAPAETAPAETAAPVAGAAVPPQNFTVPEPRRRPDYDELLAAEAAGAPRYQPEPERDAAPRSRPRVASVPRPAEGGNRVRVAILGSAVALVIGAIAVAAWWFRDDPAELPNAPVTVEAPRPAEASKIAERIGGESAPAPAPATAAQAPSRDLVVAQRAVLYEENAANPQQPLASAGRAVWRLDSVPAGQGQPLETAVRATVEIPDTGMTLNLLMRRNLDPTLPASHTIELSFTTPDEDARKVRDVGLLQLKNEEATRGAPVAGLPVPVKDNLFLIGLSNVPNDMARNEELLTRRNWVDLPIRFADGKRAIISFEKGVSGEQVIGQAFRQWGSAASAAR